MLWSEIPLFLPLRSKFLYFQHEARCSEQMLFPTDMGMGLKSGLGMGSHFSHLSLSVWIKWRMCLWLLTWGYSGWTEQPAREKQWRGAESWGREIGRGGREGGGNREGGRKERKEREKMKKRGNEGGRRAGRGEGEDKGGKRESKVSQHKLCQMPFHLFWLLSNDWATFVILAVCVVASYDYTHTNTQLHTILQCSCVEAWPFILL